MLDIVLNNHIQFYQLEEIKEEVSIFFSAGKYFLHQAPRISKICKSLPIVLNLIKLGGVVHDYQEHNVLNYFL